MQRKQQERQLAKEKINIPKDQCIPYYQKTPSYTASAAVQTVENQYQLNLRKQQQWGGSPNQNGVQSMMVIKSTTHH